MMISRQSRTRWFVPSAAVLMLLAANAAAQIGDPDWDLHPTQPLPPLQFGQWEGPYVLDAGMTQHGPMGEIAHAVYVAAGEHAGKIMFWNRPNKDFPLQYDPRSFLWDPEGRDKTQVEVKFFPVAADMSEDPFCSGHVTTREGDIFVAGGRDFYSPVLKGTRVVLLFRLSTGEWEYLTHQNDKVLLDMDRYYGSAIRWLNGDVVIVGHTGHGVPPPGDDAAFHREHFRALTGTLDPIEFNWTRQVLPSPNCDVSSGLSVWDYAKTLMLSDGQIMWSDGEERISHRHVSYFINLETPDCPSHGNPWRWRQGVLTDHPADHAGGSGVHFVLRTGPNTYDDVVYSLGGTSHGQDDNSSCAEPILDMVERFHYTGDGAPEFVEWEEAPSLRVSRKNPNAIILLDGSIFVPGGLGPTLNPEYDPEDEESQEWLCEGRLRPERFRTPEIFGGSNPKWRLMAAQQHVRPYHGVALQSADGSVVSGGGAGFPGSPSHRRSVEIYRPPYFFKTPRPEIEPLEETTVGYGDPVELFVKMTGGFPTSRVALLATGSVTHTYDWNQRYVDLEYSVDDTTAGPPLVEKLIVHMPPNDRVAPPGYYFLTVVDENDIPAPALVIKLEPDE